MPWSGHVYNLSTEHGYFVANGLYTGNTIARTEVAQASAAAASAVWDELGVQWVDIWDGSGCGWTTHDDPDKANGSRRTLEAYQAQPLSHPNCRRVALPVLMGRTVGPRR